MNAQKRCGLLAALILAPALTSGLALAQTLTAPPAPNAITAPAQKTIGVPAARQYSRALIVLNARGAKLEGQKLVLDGVLPSATLFTSRPVRSVGHMVTPDMVEHLAHRKLCQGSAERHGVGVLQGWLERQRRRGRADLGQARRRAADLRRQGPGRQSRQGRRSGVGLHRHDVVGPRFERLHLLRHEPDDRRHHAQHRRPQRHQHLLPAGPIPRPPGRTFRRP